MLRKMSSTSEQWAACLTDLCAAQGAMGCLYPFLSEVDPMR
jgi:hypothetical protein